MNCGSAWTSALPPTSCLRTWCGGGATLPAATLNAWCVNIKIRRSGSTLTRMGSTIDVEDPGKFGEAWRKNYVRYRFWTSHESILYSYDGDEILERVPHSFGRVPIVRLIDLKKHRTPTIGKSRYEAIAELQREYYNRDSELILSDTLQAHPLLSGPGRLLQGR